MRFRERSGSVLMEAAIALPLVLGATAGLIAVGQWGLWKMAADAAADAGAQVLAQGSSTAQAETVARAALQPSAGMTVSVSARETQTLATVTVQMTMGGPFGPILLTAQRSAVLVPPTIGGRGVVP